MLPCDFFSEWFNFRRPFASNTATVVNVEYGRGLCVYLGVCVCYRYTELRGLVL